MEVMGLDSLLLLELELDFVMFGVMVVGGF